LELRSTFFQLCTSLFLLNHFGSYFFDLLELASLHSALQTLRPRVDLEPCSSFEAQGATQTTTCRRVASRSPFDLLCTMAAPWMLEHYVRLRPHSPDTFIRVYHGRESRHKYPNRELIHFHGGATRLRCEYCHLFWTRGKWKDRNYRLDLRTGWWEYDDGACFCIYFDPRRNAIGLGDNLFCSFLLEMRRDLAHAYRLVSERCDLPTPYGVQVDSEMGYDWEDVIAVKAFDGLKNIGIPRWRNRLLSKNSDSLGKFLSMKAWTRLRKTCASHVDGFLTFTKLCLPWLTVTMLYTKEQQVHYDEAYADTIEYLASGTRVRPAMDMAAPHGISSSGWLYAMIEIPATPSSAFGWIHPGIVGLRVAGL
jgi:hypothetical protein